MFNFDEIIDRSNQASLKHANLKERFGRDDLIPMWVADMDFKSSPSIIKDINNRSKEGIYGYTITPNSYYESIINWYKEHHDFEIKTQFLSQSPTVITSINLIIQELTEEGDKIIIQPPIYPPFFSSIKNNNRVLLENNLIRREDSYSINFEELEYMAKESKMLILCNPHNPTGKVLSEYELKKINDICVRNNLIILSDEVHCDLVFKPKKHISMIKMNKNNIVLLSPSKTFNLAGVKASFIYTENNLFHEKISKILNILNIQSNNSFSQVAVESAYKNGEQWLDSAKEYILENMKYSKDYIDKNIPKINSYIPESTYLQWLDLSELKLNKDQIKDFLINYCKIGPNFGEEYSTNSTNYIRLNLACPRPILKEALIRLKNNCENIESIRTELNG